MGMFWFLCFWFFFFLFIGFFVFVLLIGGNCRVGEGELILDLNLLEEVLVGIDKWVKGYKRRLDVIVGKVFLMESFMLLIVLVLNDNVNGKFSNVDV